MVVITHTSSHVAVTFGTEWAFCLSYIRIIPNVLYAVDKERPMWPKRPASVVIDSATHLLTVSSPNTKCMYAIV